MSATTPFRFGQQLRKVLRNNATFVIEKTFKEREGENKTGKLK